MNNTECLISKEPIINNITLPCNHSYEYIYLYEEIKQQKNRHKTYFKCPYCRAMYYGTIPYYDIDEVEKIYAVNGNTKTTMPLLKCEWGACNFPGNKFKHGTFCWKHMKPTEVKCSGVCKNGSQCKNKCVENGLCKIHLKNITPDAVNKCGWICKNGNPCKNKSINGEHCKKHNK